MAGEQNRKVIIEDFEYKREYTKKTDANGNAYIEADNYKYWTRNIEISALKSEQIVEINNDIKAFAKETQDKFKELFDVRQNKITEGQINFSYDATMSIMGQVKNPDKITIIPAKAGFGKSSYIYSFLTTLCKHIHSGAFSKFSTQGVIIVTDKIDALRQLEKDIYSDKGYYNGKYDTKYTYILEAWNKNSFRDGICKNEAVELYEYGMCSPVECPYYNKCKMSYQKQKQVYSPILLMTNARLKQYQDRIDEYRTWIDREKKKQIRDIVIIDEKVIALIRQRFNKSNVITYNNVPIEFQQQKILGRQQTDDKKNKIQVFINWLENEWDGSKISIKDIKDKFQISDKYWDKIISNQVVKEIRTKRKILKKREGKGSNQINYWYI